MHINEWSAVVDNDFLSHTIEMHFADDEIIQILRIVFQELKVDAIMHPMVFDHELLQDKQIINDIFKEEVIVRCSFDDIFEGDSIREAYYCFAVCELYKQLHGEELSALAKSDLLNFWASRMCLGEIHSIALCLVCGCGIFLSDDKHAKELVISEIIKNSAFGNIKVYNRRDVLDRINEIGSGLLGKKQRRAFAHKITK